MLTKRKIRIIIISAILFAFLVPVISYGADDGTFKALHTLSQNGLDSIGNFGIDILRYIGWGIIKFLAYIVDGLYKSFDGVFSLMTFTTSDKLAGLIGKYKVLYKIFLTVTIVIVGLWLIIGNKLENQLNVSTCLMLMLVILLGMPIITEKMSSLTTNASKYAVSSWSEDKNFKIDSIASGLIYDQIVDLNVLDKSLNPKTGAMSRFSTYGNTSNDFKLGTDDYKYISINEGMGDENNDDLINPDVWRNKLRYNVKSKGNFETVKLTDKFYFTEYYYRYQIRSWVMLILELSASVFVLLLTLIRIVRLIIEIVMAQIYMPIVSITDIMTGQRVKEALKGFLMLFLSIFLICAILGIYFLAMTYINSLTVNGFLKFVFILGLSWSLIDGSNILERVLGVDLGLKSMGWGMAGMFTMGRLGSRLFFKTGGKAAKSGLKKSINALKSVGNTKNNNILNKNDKNMPSNGKDGKYGNKDSSNKNERGGKSRDKANNKTMPSQDNKKAHTDGINDKNAKGKTMPSSRDINAKTNKDMPSSKNINAKANKDMPSSRGNNKNKNIPSGNKKVNYGASNPKGINRSKSVKTTGNIKKVNNSNISKTTIKKGKSINNTVYRKNTKRIKPRVKGK